MNQEDHGEPQRRPVLDRVVPLLGGFAILMLATHIVLDVLLRSLANHPLTGTIEYVRFWYMVTIAFVGAVHASRQSEQIEVPILYDVTTRRVQRELRLVADGVMALFACLLIWYGFQEALSQMRLGERDGAVGVVIWPVRFLVPLAGLMLLATAATAGLRDLRRRDSPRQRERSEPTLPTSI